MSGVTERLCGSCEHAFFGSTGVYCRLFNEDIWNEKVAEECEQYDPAFWVARQGGDASPEGDQDGTAQTRRLHSVEARGSVLGDD